MNNTTHLNIFFLLILLVGMKYTEQNGINAINIIPDVSLNATAAYISLDSLNKTNKINYLYFIFDLDYHNQANPTQKNLANLKISTDLDLSSSYIEYAFINKKIEQINSTFVNTIVNYNIWRRCTFLGEGKTENENYYFTQIINPFKSFNNFHTIIIKIRYFKNEGYIMIENILKLPEEIIKKKQSHNMKHYNISNYHINFNRNITSFHKNGKHYNHNYQKYSHLANKNNNKPKNQTLNNQYSHSYINENYYNNKNERKNKKNFKSYNGYNTKIVYPDVYYEKDKEKAFHGHHRLHLWLMFKLITIFISFIFGIIWIIIFVMYCFVNKKKNSNHFIMINRINGNSQ